MRGGPFFSGRSVRPWSALRCFLTKPNGNGYTIIEVLVVLAVTAGLFVSAAIMIAGRQNRTAFEQAVRGMQSYLQSAIDEVVVGHYPNGGSFQCTATASGPAISAGSNSQGTNGGCVFVGKVIQFGVAGTNPEQFRVYTIAGLRVTAAGAEVVSRVQAMPVLIAPATADPDIPDRSTPGVLENGLTTLGVEYGSPSPTSVGGVAIWQSLATISGGVLTSSAQANHIGPIPNTSLNMTQQQFVDAANANLTSGPLDDVNGVRICFVSGGTNQSGLITLGGNNRRLTVTLDIKSNKTCS